jgi:TonB family protein
MKKVKCASLLALIATSVPALAEQPIRQPTGRWVVSFADAQCLASRDFGTKEKPLILVLKAPAIGNVMQVAVVRNGNGGEPEQLDGKLAFDDREPAATSMLAFTNRKEHQRIFVINLPLEQFAIARMATSISIRGAEQLDERFALKQMGSIIKLMDECVADLRQVWNVWDPNGPPKLKRSAQGSLVGLFSSNDYPGVALRQNQEGSVEFALLINESGRVADCTVIETSGVASLDAQGCAIVRERARFKPAIGLDGKPAKGSYFQRVNWRIGG